MLETDSIPTKPFRLKPEPMMQVVQTLSEIIRMARSIELATRNIQPLTRDGKTHNSLEEVVQYARQIEEEIRPLYDAVAPEVLGEG